MRNYLMKKFKVSSNGSGIQRSEKAFLNFMKIFEENDAKLLGNYYGKEIITTIKYEELILKTNVHNFVNQTIKRTNLLKEKCKENGDYLIGLSRKEGRVIFAKIKTFDNGIVEISNNNYGQFCSGRKRFYKTLRERGHRSKGAYLSAHKEILIDFGCGCGFLPNYPSNYMSNSGIGCFKCGKLAGGVIGNLSKLRNGNVLALKYPEIKEIWSEFNKKTPYDYTPQSHEIVYWKCSNGHDDYSQEIRAKVIQGQGCPKCGKISMSKTVNKKYSEKFYRILRENNHKALTTYKLSHSEIIIDFQCGHPPHKTTPHNYLSGARCPRCSASYGEAIICEHLDKVMEEYTPQLELENGKFYDIYIHKYNLIVEVHGLQHYEEVDMFPRTLEEEQMNDNEKEKYAKRLGYKYMIVDYREHKPKKALKRFLYQFDEFKKSIK